MAVSLENLCEIHNLGQGTKEWMVSSRQFPTLQRRQILYAGHTEAKQGYSFVRHSPRFTQALACVAGEGEVVVDGSWRPCGPGQVYVTPPRSPCAYRNRSRRPWRLAWVIIDETSGLAPSAGSDVPRLVEASVDGLHLAVQGLCRAALDERPEEWVDRWASVVMREALWLLGEPVAREGPGFRLLWARVTEDLGAAWTLRTMSRMAGMSEETLRRRCLEHFGKPPLARLAVLRLQRAADLLLGSPESVSAIALRVGYGDPFAFSTAFRREFGLSPRAFRATG